MRRMVISNDGTIGWIPDWSPGSEDPELQSKPDRSYDFGSNTVSMTWMTPFDCLTSAIVTVAV